MRVLRRRSGTGPSRGRQLHTCVCRLQPVRHRLPDVGHADHVVGDLLEPVALVCTTYGVLTETAEELEDKTRKMMGLEGEVNVYLVSDGRRSDWRRRKDREHHLRDDGGGEKQEQEEQGSAESVELFGRKRTREIQFRWQKHSRWRTRRFWKNWWLGRRRDCGQACRIGVDAGTT